MVIVSVSVAPTLASPTVACANGLLGISEVDLSTDDVPAMVGATAGSMSVTLVVLSTTGAPPALLWSLSVKVVGEVVLGAPAFGVKTRGVEFAGDRGRGS